MANTRKTILFLHRWLGLSSGLVVFILAFTGCLFAFQEEIFEAVRRDTLYIEQVQATKLPVSVLREKAQAALGEKYPVNTIVTHSDPHRAWEFEVMQEDPEALTYFGHYVCHKTAYLNPYTGQVTGVINTKYEFFTLVKMLHWSLWLSTELGQPIVGTSTLLFFLLLLSGLVLWWPGSRNKKAVQQRFKVKWGAKFKRLNYDLHNVPGFYISMVSAVVALTGLVMAFTWVLDTVYFVANAGPEPPSTAVKLQAPAQQSFPAHPLDKIFQTSRSLFPEAAALGVYSATEKDSLVTVYVKEREGVYFVSDNLTFRGATGEPVKALLHRNRNTGEKLLYMNYDIHVGAVLGMPGKILAFLASLVCTSLPVTGFIIWFGKRNKKHGRDGRLAPARARAKQVT